MSRLTWNEVGTHNFEVGIDRVVLYSVNGMAIAWNGVQSITEKVDGAQSTPLYIDGVKFLESRVYGDYAATIEAMSAPREFGAHDGTAFDMSGIGYGLQPIKPFAFSYRTLVGNDVDREDHAYKIHIVFNAYATPSERTYQTIGSETEPSAFSWDISTIPSRIVGRRPTAHLVIDSRYTDPGLLSGIEDQLYGGDGVIGRVTTAQEFVNFISEYLEMYFYTEYDDSGTYELVKYRAYKRNTPPVLDLGEEAFWLDTSGGDGSYGRLKYVIGD